MNQHDSSHRIFWLPDGHVSDWVLNALVDNEMAIVPDDAISHVDTCEHCTDRMATLAHVAFALAEELTQLSHQPAKQKVPFPRVLFAVTSLVTVGLGLFSWAIQGTAIVEIPHELLTVWRGLRLVGSFAAQQLGGVLIVLSSLTILTTAIAGVILAKRHPLTRSPESPS